MSNSISFIGRLARDGELKKAGESDLLEISVGNSIGYGTKKSTNWFKCSIWGKQAISLEQYLTKGKEVFVCGELTLREYTNKEGVKKISPEVRVSSIDFCSGTKEGEKSESAPAPAAPQKKQYSPEVDDDMPF
jgi:single-strand DNA-binding protein